MHRYAVNTLAKFFQEKGGKVLVEYSLNTGGSIDFVVDDRIAIEFETGESDIRANVEKLLKTGFQKKVVVCLSGKARKEAENHNSADIVICNFDDVGKQSAALVIVEVVLGMVSISKSEVNSQQILENELERVKKILNVGYDLKVKWIPRNNGNLCGEVKGDYIFIYDGNIEDALMTLKHEIVDYAVSEVIEPYMQVTNKLIALLNERAYKQKELLIGKLVALL